MSEQSKKWYYNPWILTLGGGIFSLICTIVYDSIKSKPILTTVAAFFTWFWNLIISVLTFNIQVWWILVVLFLIVIYAYFRKPTEHIAPKEPDFFRYKSDKFKYWKWSWEYRKSGNQWSIINLEAHCPKCDTPMLNHSSAFTPSYTCPRCDFSAFNRRCDSPEKVEAVIIDNINRGRTSLSSMQS